MNNQVVLSPNMSDEEFNRQLNLATGHAKQLRMQQIKFNAEEGLWQEETGEIDDQGKPIYAPIGEKLEMHIITTRKMVQSKYNTDGLYSRETRGDWFEVIDKNKEIVLSGSWKSLKKSNPNLIWTQVLYVYVNNKPYKIKLSSSKLSQWFDYQVAGNPALNLTIAGRGQRVKKSGNEIIDASEEDIKRYEKALDNRKKPDIVLFYELNFTKSEPVDRTLIIQRVNDINQYFNVVAEIIKGQVKPSDEVLPPEPEVNFDDEPKMPLSEEELGFNPNEVNL